MAKWISGRPLSALLCMSLLFLSVACSKSAVAPATTYRGTLTLWTAPGLAGLPVPLLTAPWLEEQAIAYEAAHRGVTVQVRRFGSAHELESALLAGPTDQPWPDLVFGRPLPELAPKLADLGSRLNSVRTDYYPNGLAAFRNGDQQFGLPVLLEVPALALNQQAFTAAGVPLPEDGRWSWDAFENSVKRLSGKGQYGLGFYHLPGYHEWWALAGGVVRQDMSLSPDAEEGLSRLIKFRQDGLLHPDTGKVKAEEIWALFAKSQPEIAVMPVASWALTALRDQQVNFTVAAFPGDLTVGNTYGFSFVRQEEPAKLNAALDLAQFAVGSDRQVKLARESGLLPARKSAGNPFEGDAAMSRLHQMAAMQQPLPAGPAWDQAQAGISRPLLLALLGAQEPKTALEQVRQTMAQATAPASR